MADVRSSAKKVQQFLPGLPWASALATALVATILSVATSLGSADFVAGAPAKPVDAGLIKPDDPGMVVTDEIDPGMIEPAPDLGAHIPTHAQHEDNDTQNNA